MSSTMDEEMPTLVAGVNNQIWLLLCNHSCKGAPMIHGARIKSLLEDRGLSQSALARAIGVSPQAINKIAGGGASNSVHLYKIAQFLGCTPEYLTGDSDEVGTGPLTEKHQSFGALPVQRIEDVAEEAGLVPVRQIDLAYGMGATFLDMVVDEVTQFFPVDWLRQFTKAPASKLFFAQGVGDSMQPTLAPNDTLIIDTSVDRLTMSDQIWAVTYCGLGMIKRLRPTKDGGIRIMSDNALVPEEVAYDGELNLVGRVVAVMRKV